MANINRTQPHRKKGFHPLIASRQTNELWAASFAAAEFHTEYTHYAVQKTAPHAICLAALKAVEA